MIGFYVKPAGLERELDRELFWRPEVYMTNLSHSCFVPAPSMHQSSHSTLFMRFIREGYVRCKTPSCLCGTPHFSHISN